MLYAVGAGVAVAVAVFYGGFKAGENSAEASTARVDAAMVASRNAAMEGAANAIAANKPISMTITNEVQREIRTNTVYATCLNTPAGLRGINEAITGKRPVATGNK